MIESTESIEAILADKVSLYARERRRQALGLGMLGTLGLPKTTIFLIGKPGRLRLFASKHVTCTKLNHFCPCFPKVKIALPTC